MSHLPAAYFEAQYAARSDPWGFTDRWYEERKRAVTLASLPARRYRRALEVGCSIGVLTEGLSRRCEDVLALDLSEAAIAQARERLAASPTARLAVLDVADGVPEGPFDLIVLSEVLYYFSAPTLRRVLTELVAQLADDAVIVACHWRHPVREYPLSGDDVHAALTGITALVRVVRHDEEDFLLEVLARDGRSVAAREGLA